MSLMRELFPRAEIYNPAYDEDAEQEYEYCGMTYFLNEVGASDLLCFRALPDGRIPAGVAKEIQCAREHGIPVIELPRLNGRTMTVEDTREYLMDSGYR